MSIFISDAIAQTGEVADATNQAAAGNSLSLIMLVAIFVLFYFMLIRPQNKRAKEHRDLISNLKVGDEVTTAGGIMGRIASMDEQFVKLEVADGVKIAFARTSVSTVLPKGTVKLS